MNYTFLHQDCDRVLKHLDEHGGKMYLSELFVMIRAGSAYEQTSLTGLLISKDHIKQKSPLDTSTVEKAIETTIVEITPAGSEFINRTSYCNELERDNSQAELLKFQIEEHRKQVHRFDKTNLSGIIQDDAIDEFIRIEKLLIEKEYFNDTIWKNHLDEAAAFIERLSTQNYLLNRRTGKDKWITKTVKPFFEKRYGIAFTKQLQPKYRKDKKLQAYLNWIDKI